MATAKEQEQPQPKSRLIRIREVVARTSLSRPTIYRKMEDGTFPRSRRIDRKTIAWFESDIEDWFANLPIADPKQGFSANRKIFKDRGKENNGEPESDESNP